MNVINFDCIFLTLCFGVYSTWFTPQSKGPTFSTTPSLLMNSISYVVAALPELVLCLPAANALRDMCNANCAALVLHIGAFAELHAGLNDILVREMVAWSANPLMS